MGGGSRWVGEERWLIVGGGTEGQRRIGGEEVTGNCGAGGDWASMGAELRLSPSRV